MRYRTFLVLLLISFLPVSSVFSNAFAQPFLSLQIESPGPSVWGDYDGDGALDILTAESSPEGFIPVIYRNDVGLFKRIETGLDREQVEAGFDGFGWGDYDGDGDLDLLVTGGVSAQVGV